MNVSGYRGRFPRPYLVKEILVSLLLFLLLFATRPQRLWANQDPQANPQTAPQGAPEPPYAQQTSEQLQQLVAPIALYPDSLVAQILAASAFPDQVVEADRWAQAHSDLKGNALAQAVDQQLWDPSVKALTAFPSVLGNMDKNLSWTSSLGDAYYNQQADVMDAVQAMRQKAQQAGSLKTTPQDVVTDQGPTVTIQPVDPDVVYVPAYDPWLVYGDPILPWPEWYPYPGIWFGGPYLSWGIGFPIGFYGGYGWGWGNWGFDWHDRHVLYNHNLYVSRSNTFYNRNAYYRGGGQRGVAANVQRGVSGDRGGFDGRSGQATRPFNSSKEARGYTEPRGQSGVRSGAMSGYGSGGDARAYSSRGSASYGGGGFGGGSRGGGGFGGGGGFHGGGGGGGRR